MAEYIYVDNSNVFIEGKKIAAQKRGLNRDSDFNFRLDFGELYDFVAESEPEKISRALLLGIESAGERQGLDGCGKRRV